MIASLFSISVFPTNHYRWYRWSLKSAQTRRIIYRVFSFFWTEISSRRSHSLSSWILSSRSLVPKWLIYVPRSHEVLRIMNQTERNRWFRLPWSYLFIYARFYHTRILRESRFPCDYLGAALRHIARYRHILHARSTSSRVFARPGTGSAVTLRAAQADSDRPAIIEFPGEDFPRESEVSGALNHRASL